MPRYTSEARQLAYEYISLLRRRRDIPADLYRKEKAKIDKREAKSVAQREAKEEAKRQAQEAKRQQQEAKRQQEERKKLEEKKKKQDLRVTGNKVERLAKMIDRTLSAGVTFSRNLLQMDKEYGLSVFVKALNKVNKKLILVVGSGENKKYFVLSDVTRNRLLEAIGETLVTETENVFQSGREITLEWRELRPDDIVEVSLFEETHERENPNGAFFRYTHNTMFDFRAYGIYKTGEQQDHSNNCLINALARAGVDVERVKCMVKNRTIPRKDLTEICKIANIEIKLKLLDDKHSNKVYGKGNEKKVLLGLIDNHYFLVEKTEVTSYCLNNYNTVKDLPECSKIIALRGNSYERNSNRYIDSFDVIKCLLANPNLITEMTMDDKVSASTQFYDKISSEIVSLKYDENSCIRPAVKDSKKKKDTFENVVFDFETDSSNVHKPYLVSILSSKLKKTFYGETCGLQMLSYLLHIGNNVRLIAHNATYDYTFLMKNLREIKKLARGSRLISLTAKFGSSSRFIKVQIKDSYKLITTSLKKFPEIFGLKQQKEVMPYSIYTQENINKRYLPIDEVLTVIADEDKKQFLENIDKWELRVNDTYDIVEYSARYCEIDCDILWNGYKTFRKWMLECVDIDINDTLTIASLAHTYFIKQGCYDGVNELGGVPQLFIQGAVVGGRTMCADNKKIVLNEKVNDFDAVSLYPSAMARMPGFLKGKPKVIENHSYDWVKQQDGYFVDILIKSVGINRAFPLMSYKTEQGIRMFTNDMVQKTIRVDKTTLEDLIQFHNITFDIIRGYYFNDGFNPKVCETIKYLFSERLAKKKQKNPAEVIYKLIMNSSYGKSIMKAVDEECRIFDDDYTFNTYLSRNYNWAKSYVKFGSKTELNSVKSLNDHYNIAHVGVCILSMSKRIMNEVMCLAEDKQLELYYQDTDSIHIKDRDIQQLSSAFQEKYNRELIGKAMGQFHSDFSMKGCSNITARRSIFLGKKSYIDELVGYDSEGNEHIDYHIRMKGIPETCMYYTATKNGYANVFEMYEALLTGKKIEADLTEGGSKANFKFNDDYSIHTLSVFKRTMAF